VHIWRLNAQDWQVTPITSLGTEDSLVDQFTFSPDGAWFVVGRWQDRASSTSAVELYDGQRFAHVATLAAFSAQSRPDETVEDVAFSPDGQVLGLVRYKGIVEAWSVATQHMLASMKVHPWEESPAFANTRCLAWAPNGRWIATGGWERVQASQYQQIVAASGWEQLPVEPSSVDFVIRLWEVRKPEEP